MITANQILTMIPTMPPTSKEILQRLGNTEIHIPGLPSLPSGEISGPLKDSVIAVLGQFDFEFYQKIGFRATAKGVPLGGAGVSFSEILNVKNPVPNLHLTPILEIGQPKE